MTIQTTSGVAAGVAEVVTIRYSRLTLIGAYLPTGCLKPPLGEQNNDEICTRAKINFELGIQRHLEKEKTRGEPMVVLMDGNTAPTEADIHPGAAKELKAKIPADRSWPGTSPAERESHQAILKAGDLVDAWRSGVAQSDKESYTWYVNRFERCEGKGIRYDQCLISSELAQKAGRSALILDGIDNLQTAGGCLMSTTGSDHTPLHLKLRQREAATEEEPQLFFLYKEKDQKYYTNWKIKPNLTVSIATSKDTSIDTIGFLDTGSDFTIGNPDPGFTPEDDPHFKNFVNNPSAFVNDETMHIGGLGNSRTQSKLCRLIPISLAGGRYRNCEVLLLAEHDTSLPKILIGLSTMTNSFKGVTFERITKGEHAGKIGITTGIQKDRLMVSRNGTEPAYTVLKRPKPNRREEDSNAFLVAARSLEQMARIQDNNPKLASTSDATEIPPDTSDDIDAPKGTRC